MSFRIRRIAAVATAVAVGALCLLGVGASAVSAAPHTSTGKTEHFIFTVAGSHSSGLAHGLFAGAGRDDASHDNYDILYVSNGSLRINHPDSQSHFSYHLNHTSCYASFTITGKYTLRHGTGRLAGYHGHGTYRATEYGLLPKTKSGACSMKAEPYTVGIIYASGPAWK